MGNEAENEKKDLCREVKTEMGEIVEYGTIELDILAKRNWADLALYEFRSSKNRPNSSLTLFGKSKQELRRKYVFKCKLLVRKYSKAIFKPSQYRDFAFPLLFPFLTAAHSVCIFHVRKRL